jgi:hypothetical protein
VAGSEATFQHGLRQAISTPFYLAQFLIVGFTVVLVGRMLIDLFITGSDPAGLQAAEAALRRDIELTHWLPNVGGPATERALRWAAVAHEWLFMKTGIDQTLIAPDVSELEYVFRRGMSAAVTKPHWQAAMLGVQTLVVRASMLQTMLPTLALVYGVAIVDGIVSRWLRREGGGRESSTIYHRSKYLHTVGATLFVMTWFWYPGSFNFWFAASVMIAMGGLLLRTQLMYYKKYI